MRDIREINREYQAKFEIITDMINNVFDIESREKISYYNEIKEWFKAISDMKKKLVLKIDDSYILYRYYDDMVWSIKGKHALTSFKIYGLGFDMKKEKLLTCIQINENCVIEIIEYDDFMLMFDKFKQKKYDTSDENVKFQYEYHTPFAEHEIIQRYPEYFKEEYISEFYKKINIIDRELNF